MLIGSEIKVEQQPGRTSNLHEGIQGDGRLAFVSEAAGAVGDGLPVALQLPLEVLVAVVDLWNRVVSLRRLFVS